MLSIIPTGVCGETDDVGDVDCEYEGSDISGVRGMLLRGLWVLTGEDFGGDA